jgi:AbrB family looped-hinge helix DNA binding protein
MDTGHVTSKGQLVIPAQIRRRYGIKPGTKIRFIERDQEILIQPVTREYIMSVRGMLKSDTSATEELLAERAREKELEEKSKNHGTR